MRKLQGPSENLGERKEGIPLTVILPLGNFLSPLVTIVGFGKSSVVFEAD